MIIRKRNIQRERNILAEKAWAMEGVIRAWFPRKLHNGDFAMFGQKVKRNVGHIDYTRKRVVFYYTEIDNVD